MGEKPNSSVATNSPRRRKISFLALLVLLPAAVAGFYFYQRFSAEARLQKAIEEADRLDPDWRFADLEAHRKEVPDAENGILQALEARRLLPDGLFPWEPKGLADGSGPMALPWDPPVQPRDDQIQRIRSELQRARAALAEARKLADIPNGRQHVTLEPDYARRIVLTLPNPYIGQDLIQVANLLGYNVLLQAQDGDLAQALRSTRAFLYAGRCIGDEPSPAQHTRWAIQSRAWKKAEHVVAQGEPRPTDLELAQRAFEEEAEEPVFYFALRGERGILDDFLKNVQAGAVPFKIVRRHLGRLFFRDSRNQFEENLDTLAFILSVRRERSELLRFINCVVEMARASPDQQAARVQQLGEESLKDRPSLIVKLLAAEARRSVEAADHLRAELRCTAVALAAERYRRARGQWPASLADLVPDYVVRIPNDPFDGRPLKLAKHAQGITIYSVGLDGADNGGNIDVRKGWNAPGTDRGFRLWDVKFRRQPAQPRRKPGDEPAN
jgi:hypothetical protein